MNRTSGERPPIIVLLLGWILQVVKLASNTFCITLWLLPRLWFNLTSNFVMNRPQTVVGMVFQSLPRLLCGVGYPFIVLAELAAAASLALSTTPPTMGAETAIITTVLPALFVMTFALYRGAKLSPASCPGHGYWHAVRSTMNDVGATACGLAVACLLLRAPQLFCGTSVYQFSRLAPRELLRSLTDWLVAPSFVLLWLTRWRLAEVTHVLAAASQEDAEAKRLLPGMLSLTETATFSAAYSRSRAMVLLKSWSVILDTLCFTAAIPVLISWRSRTLIQRIQSTPGPHPKRLVCIDELIELLIDIPHLFLAGIVLLSHRHSELAKCMSANKPNLRAYTRAWFAITVADVLTVLACCVTVVPTIYRLSNLHYALNQAPVSLEPSFHKHRLALYHAARVIVEMPCWVGSLLVFITGYRALTLVSTLRHAPLDERGWLCLEAAAAVVVDVPYFACGVLSIAAFWRLPCFIRKLQSSRCCAELREAAVDNLRQALIDLPYLLMGLLSLMAVWRWFSFVRKLHTVRICVSCRLKNVGTPVCLCGIDSVDDAPKVCVVWREVAQANFVAALSDMPYFMMGLASALAFWRLPGFIHKLRVASGSTERRKAAQENLVEAINDVPYGAMGVLSLVAVWRLIGFTHKLYRSSDAKCRREAAQDNLIDGITDIPYILMGTLSFLGVWRLPFFLQKNLRDGLSAVERRKAAKENLIESLTDLPYVTMALLSLMAVWRLPSFILRLHSNATAVERRATAQENLLTASLDVPFIALGMLSSFALWRWLPAAASFRLADDVARRRMAFEIFVLAMADIIAPISALVVLLTMWRAYPMITAIKLMQIQKSSDKQKNVDKSPAAVGCTEEGSLKEEGSLTFKSQWFVLAMQLAVLSEKLMFHRIIFAETIQLLIESPYIILQLVPLWRISTMWRALTTAPSDSMRRKLCREHCMLALADLICVLAAMIVVCTGWCARSMLRDLYSVKHDASDRFWWHRLVLRWLLLLICDLPFILLLSVSCLMPWRISFVFELVHKMEKESFSRKIKSSSVLASHAALDIPCAVLSLMLLLTWRMRCAHKIIIASYYNGAAFHKPVLRLAISFLVDVPFVLVSPLCLWRWPLLIWHAVSQLDRAAAENRKLVLHSIMFMLLDIVSAAAFVVVALIPWNTAGAVVSAIASLKESLSTDKTATQPAVVTLKRVALVLPTDTNSHGLVFELDGTKPEGFTFTSAVMHLEGQIWETLTKALGAASVGAAKFALHPVSLCPQFLEPQLVKPGTTDFSVKVQIACGYRGGPKLSHKTLERKVNSLVQAADCKVGVRINYAGGSEAMHQGVLCRFKFKLSNIEEQTTLLSQMGWSSPVSLEGESLDQTIEAQPEAKDAGPCQFHVGALKCFSSAVAKLPIELMALSLVLLPPLLRWPRVLSILFGVGPWRVPAEERSNALRRDAIGNIKDLLAITGFAVTAMVPWNFLPALQTAVAAARLGYNSGTGQEFHDDAFETTRWALVKLPWEILALAMSCLPPSLNFGHMLTVLFSPRVLHRRGIPRDQRIYISHLSSLAQQGILSCVSLVSALLIMLSLWRVPTLCKRLRSEFSKHRKDRCQTTATGNRRMWQERYCVECNTLQQITWGIFDVFQLLLVDCLQILEVVFILGTLVHAPTFLMRVWILAKLRLKQWSQKQSPSLVPVQRPSTHLSRFDCIPERLLTDSILPHLDAGDLCNLSETCYRLHEMSSRGTYWLPLYRSQFWRIKFNETPAALDPGSNYAKRMYAEAYTLRKQGQKTLDQQDDDQGFRFVIHHEFLATLESGDLWHLPLLPFKICGILAIPVHMLLKLRYRACFPFANDAQLARDLQSADSCMQQTRSSHPAIIWTMNFWSMHSFFGMTLEHCVRALIGNLGTCVTLLNAALFTVCTFGWPLWLQLVPSGKSILANILTGVFFPLFILTQLFIAFLPTAAASWWSWKLVLDASMSWVTELYTLLGDMLTISLQHMLVLMSGAASILHSAAELSIYPYIVYWAPSLGSIPSLLQDQAVGITASLSTQLSCAAKLGFDSISVRLAFPLLHLELGRLHTLLYAFVWPLETAINMEITLLSHCHRYLLGTPFSYLSSLLMAVVECISQHKLVFIQLVWLIVMWNALCYSWKLLRTCFPGVQPLQLYTMPMHLARKIMRLNFTLLRSWLCNLWRCVCWIGRLYTNVLAIATRLLRRLGTLGDVILTPCALAWMLWPVHVPIYTEQHHLLISAVPFALFLCSHGKHVIEINWR